MYPTNGNQAGQYPNTPNPQATQQWPPNPNTAPPTSQPGQQPALGPNSWAAPPPPTQQQSYQQQQQQQQPRSPAPPLPASASMAPPTMQTAMHPDPYRSLPPPQPQMYPPGYQQMPYPPAQPAPRQRTAIACRYCRRRKIRCSGFDQSEDGRCSNCQRFSQECVFTPVSAQTQAFVPAHTVWRGQNPPPNTQLYGAYGQPLPHGSRDPFQQPQQPGQYPPPPQGYQQQPMYQQPPAAQVQQGQSTEGGRKRSNDEPHAPTLPPHQRADSQALYYPDPSGLTAEKDGSTDGVMMGASEEKEKVRNVRDVGVQVDMAKDTGR